MKEAVFQYKCRMCGAVFDDRRTSLTAAASVLDTKTFGSIRPADETVPHLCDETRVGLADLIGYRIEG